MQRDGHQIVNGRFHALCRAQEGIMNSRRLFPVFLVALGLTASWSALAADAPVPVGLGPKSTLWLEGTSTMHDYESTAGIVRVTMTRDGTKAAPVNVADLETLIRESGIRGVQVEIPVTSMKSKKDGLDKNMYKTLKATEHPTIRCELTSYSVAPAKSGGDTLDLRAEGTLEVAGAKRPVKLAARAWRSADGVWIAGTQPLKMSEFGIKPPTMMMGTLRVGDAVTVSYRLLLVPKNGEAAATPAAEPQKGAVR
jgi:hypothetical protein